MVIRISNGTNWLGNIIFPQNIIEGQWDVTDCKRKDEEGRTTRLAVVD